MQSPARNDKIEKKSSNLFSMRNDIHPFEILTGSDRLGTKKGLTGMLIFIFILAILISKAGLISSMVLLLVPLVFLYLFLLFKYPLTGLYSAIILGFFILGIARYIPNFQVGLMMDGILFLTYIALIFNKFYDRVEWKPAKKDITNLALIWFGYSLLQFFNPEVRNRAAWLAGMRGISLYMVLIIPLVLILIDNRKKMDVFLYIWCICSILATLKGIMQKTIGVDPWEKAWLDNGGAITHIIFGQLRIFSFMSDAGQFGANQGFTGVTFSIIAFAEKNIRKKILYAVVAVLGIYGMFISGTRGAIAVPLAGFFLYSFLRKNWYVIGTGLFLLTVVFVFFKYTSIGQNNDQIRRMRSAFDPNDPSLQIRIENQKKLKVYLATRPFGGGIGHAGVKAQKYLPNAFLSNVATDSWYVLIWAEQGIVGLLLHLFILFYVVIKGSFLIMYRIRNPLLRIKMSGMISGMFGVMVASYGNAVLGTLPTGVLIYISMALLLNAKQYDDPESILLESSAKKP